MGQFKEATTIGDKTLMEFLLATSLRVGTIYETKDGTFDPNVEWGGTWTRIKGRVIVGVDESDTDFASAGLQVGEKKHTLTATEMPSHTHTFSHTHGTPSTSISSSGAHTHTTTAKSVTDILKVDSTTIKWNDTGAAGSSGRIASSGNKSIQVNIPALSIASSGAHTHTVPAMTTSSQSTTTSGSKGSGGSHNNIQPSETAYIWERVA